MKGEASPPAIFHLHPLRRCNLRCLHCYSDSAPDAPGMLGLAEAQSALALACRWGYRQLALSGGEPMLWPHLEALLEFARTLGMQASLVTNGMQAVTPRSLRIYALARTVTVSIDGLQDEHDFMRGRRGAYLTGQRTLQGLVGEGVAPWISCGVTSKNLDHIDQIAENAHAIGAAGINFHVVEKAGRAQQLSDHYFLNEEQRTLLFTIAHILAASYRGELEVHVDLLHKSTIQQRPQLLYADSGASRQSSLPAEHLAVLVMSADGLLTPVCYGFHPRYTVGRLGASGTAAADDMWDGFRNATYPALLALGASLLEELAASDDQLVLNPGDALAQRSYLLAA